MRMKLLLVFAAMLLASLANAQPASVTFSIYNPESPGPVMYEDCNAIPVPDGRLIAFYWDLNNNGPDEADNMLGIYDESNPRVGDANYNTDRVNGMEFLGVPGTYSPDSAALVIPLLPNPARLYAFIYCNDDMSWNHVTPVLDIVPGPQDIYVSTTTCLQLCEHFECDPPTTHIVMVCPDPPNPATNRVCALLSDVVPVQICVCVPREGIIPQGHFEPGCEAQPDCEPAEGWMYDDNAWEFVAMPAPHYNNSAIRTGGGCCATYVLDYCLPVDGLQLTSIGRGNSVELRWQTAAEYNLDKFIIERDGQRIAELRAANSPEGFDYAFVDRSARNGNLYNYTLTVLNSNGSVAGTASVDGVSPSATALVTEYALHQNYPNPFNPTTRIRFDLVESQYVTLKIFNANGQEVTTLVNGQKPLGVNEVSFDAAALPSGLYFYTVQIGNVYSSTKKMLLIK